MTGYFERNFKKYLPRINAVSEATERFADLFTDGDPEITQGFNIFLQAIGDNSKHGAVESLFSQDLIFESPIEKLFFLSFCSFIISYSNSSVFIHHGGFKRRINFSFDEISEAVIFPQRIIGNFRVDFLIEYSQVELVKSVDKNDWVEVTRASKIIVECDGHDFHERTKDQAKRDKSRDRILSQTGYTVFHYTGSELHTAPVDAAKQVYDFLISKLA